MGNLCSKSSNEPDHFSQPGRVLGASSAGTAPPTTASVPQKLTTSTPGRTLGSREGNPPLGPNDARSAAAKAAEERAAAAAAKSGGGKLSTQLSAQKKQTQNQVLNAGSEQERRQREIDASTAARTYN